MLGRFPLFQVWKGANSYGFSFLALRQKQEEQNADRNAGVCHVENRERIAPKCEMDKIDDMLIKTIIDDIPNGSCQNEPFGKAFRAKKEKRQNDGAPEHE